MMALEGRMALSIPSFLLMAFSVFLLQVLCDPVRQVDGTTIVALSNGESPWLSWSAPSSQSSPVVVVVTATVTPVVLVTQTISPNPSTTTSCPSDQSASIPTSIAQSSALNSAISPPGSAASVSSFVTEETSQASAASLSTFTPGVVSNFTPGIVSQASQSIVSSQITVPGVSASSAGKTSSQTFGSSQPVASVSSLLSESSAPTTLETVLSQTAGSASSGSDTQNLPTGPSASSEVTSFGTPPVQSTASGSIVTSSSASSTVASGTTVIPGVASTFSTSSTSDTTMIPGVGSTFSTSLSSVSTPQALSSNVFSESSPAQSSSSSSGSSLEPVVPVLISTESSTLLTTSDGSILTMVISTIITISPSTATPLSLVSTSPGSGPTLSLASSTTSVPAPVPFLCQTSPFCLATPTIPILPCPFNTSCTATETVLQWSCPFAASCTPNTVSFTLTCGPGSTCSSSLPSVPLQALTTAASPGVTPAIPVPQSTTPNDTTVCNTMSSTDSLGKCQSGAPWCDGALCACPRCYLPSIVCATSTPTNTSTCPDGWYCTVTQTIINSTASVTWSTPSWISANSCATMTAWDAYDELITAADGNSTTHVRWTATKDTRTEIVLGVAGGIGGLKIIFDFWKWGCVGPFCPDKFRGHGLSGLRCLIPLPIICKPIDIIDGFRPPPVC